MVLEFAIRTFKLCRAEEKTFSKWYWWGGSLLICLNIFFALILWTTAGGEEPGESVDDEITGGDSGRLRFLSEVVVDETLDDPQAQDAGAGTTEEKDKFGKGDLMLVVILSLWMDLGNIALIAVYHCMDATG